VCFWRVRNRDASASLTRPSLSLWPDRRLGARPTRRGFAARLAGCEARLGFSRAWSAPRAFGLRSTVLVSLCALAGLLALAGAPAQAAITHKYLSRITEVPAEGRIKKPLHRMGCSRALTP
jgi:hypothetical protein